MVRQSAQLGRHPRVVDGARQPAVWANKRIQIKETNKKETNQTGINTTNTFCFLVYNFFLPDEVNTKHPFFLLEIYIVL